jgi:hypothetical protein
MNNTTRITITGFIVGPIWWPSGSECWKDLKYDATDQQARTDGKMTLRDHVLRASMDGDFQSCSLAAGELHIETTHVRASGTVVRRRRSWSLYDFPSIADCLHEDRDWLPCWPDEDELAA